MAPQTRSRPATRAPSSRTVRFAPRSAASSPAGFGSPRPSSAPPQPRTGGRTQQGTQNTPARPTQSPSPGSRAASSAGRGRGRPALRYQRPERIRQTAAPSGNYQPVILAEFIGVIMIIALSPVAKGASSQGVSPYGGGDMVKLAAATLLYVVLGFVSTASQGAARIAAWFGGLTLIAVGLAEGASVAGEIGLFTGKLAAAASGPQPAAGEAAAGGAAGEGSAGSAVTPNGPQGVPVSLTGQGKPL